METPLPNLRERILAAMAEQQMSKADLSRKAGVPYHTIDKFLKGVSERTSAENAMALTEALGIRLDGQAEYQELRTLFLGLTEEQQQFVLASIRGLLASGS